ncbi:hypothetical protein [Acidithiobacillus thiooxidans]|uniref:hypothetical protein n=1 Tax=Acidithiobacillus thiooxidans TaxID=930 RepID=UPI00111DB760|nr:hypothetical protein [Acidithiobacillus thiooxidans]
MTKQTANNTTDNKNPCDIYDLSSSCRTYAGVIARILHEQILPEAAINLRKKIAKEYGLDEPLTWDKFDSIYFYLQYFEYAFSFLARFPGMGPAINRSNVDESRLYGILQFGLTSLFIEEHINLEWSENWKNFKENNEAYPIMLSAIRFLDKWYQGDRQSIMKELNKDTAKHKEEEIIER